MPVSQVFSVVPRFWLWLVIWDDGKSGRPLVGPLRVSWDGTDQGMTQRAETAVSSCLLFVKAKMRLDPQEDWIQAQNAKGARGETPTRGSGYRLLSLHFVSSSSGPFPLPALSSAHRCVAETCSQCTCLSERGRCPGQGRHLEPLCCGYGLYKGCCPPPEPDSVQLQHSTVC